MLPKLCKLVVMNTSQTVYKANLRTISTHLLSGDKVITDAPPDNNGRGEAFSPTDLLATSLACCMLTIMGIASKTKGFDIDNTTATCLKVMAAKPRRVAEIHIKLVFPPNDYTIKQKDLIAHISKTCPVALSLHPDLKQVIEIQYS
jgi:putative redox protein